MFLIRKYGNEKKSKNIYLKYKSNTTFLTKIKYIFNTFILNLKLKFIWILFWYYINYGIKKLTIKLHPLDIYTIFIDSQNINSGFKNFKESIWKSEVFDNNLNILFSENIFIDSKKYPYYYWKYFLELLFLNSYKNVDFLRVNEIPSKTIIATIKIIFNLFSMRDKIYFNLLHEYMFTSNSFYRNDLESWEYFKNKEIFGILKKDIKNNFNDFWINYKYLSLLHILNYKNDTFSENHYKNNISRIKFIWEKLSKYKNHYNEILNLYDDFFDFSSYLLLTQLPHTYRYNINDKENYQKIIDFLWYYDLNDYIKEVKNNWQKYYLSNNLLELNKILLIDSKPIIKHIYPEFPNTLHYTINYRFISNIFFYKIREKIWKEKFWNYIENYFSEYFKYQLEEKSSKEFKNKYKFWNSVEYIRNYGEIDFYIYNKETKNLILFEVKFKDELNEKIYYKKDIIKLTSEWWEIYKWIHQLYKHKEKLKLINEKLNLWWINSVKYSFINFNKSAMWNMIMRDFLELWSEKYFFWDFNYTFMSLEEFELFVSICCTDNIDFYDLLEQKTNMTVWFPHYSFLANYTVWTTEYYKNIRDNPITWKKSWFIEDDMRQFLYWIVDDINKYTTFDFKKSQKS